MPDGWAASAGGLPAMTERVAFLMKDPVLLAVSFCLLRQDVITGCYSDGSGRKVSLSYEREIRVTTRLNGGLLR